MKKPKPAPRKARTRPPQVLGTTTGPLDPAALGKQAALGRLPALGQGLVRPTLKPTGVTMSAIKATPPTLTPKPPRLPGLSSAPAPSPLGAGQLGEQTAQSVVQTARQQAPRPAAVRPVGLPTAPANPQGMPKVGSHGLAQADLLAALIHGPGHGPTPAPTPHDAPDTGAACEHGGDGGWVKAGGAGRSFDLDQASVAVTSTTHPSHGPGISAHDRVSVLGLVKLAQPPAGSVLAPNPATSPLTGVSPAPVGGSTLPNLSSNPNDIFRSGSAGGLGGLGGSAVSGLGGGSPSGLFGPAAPPVSAQPQTAQPQTWAQAFESGTLTMPDQPPAGGRTGHFGTGSGPVAFPTGGGSVLADLRQNQLLHGNGPQVTGPDGEDVTPRHLRPPAPAPARPRPAPTPPPPDSLAGRAAARTAEYQAAQPQDPVGRAIVGVIKPLITPIELMRGREYRPDTTMDQRPEHLRPVERHAPLTATPPEIAATAATFVPGGAWGRVLGLPGRAAVPAARTAPLLGGGRQLAAPAVARVAPAAAEATAPAAAGTAAHTAPGYLDALTAPAASRAWFGQGAGTAAEAAAPAAAPATRLGTVWNATRHTAATALDPLGVLGRLAVQAGQNSPVLPTLSNILGRATQGLLAIPRYATGSAFWGNLFRGQIGGIGAGFVAPIAAAGVTGSGVDNAFRAPITYLGDWWRSVEDLAGGNPRGAADALVGNHAQQALDHTGRPLNRIMSNVAAGTQSALDPLKFVGSRFVAGFQNVGNAIVNKRNDRALTPAQAIEQAQAQQSPHGGPGIGNPADPNFQYDLFGDNDEAARRQRADAHIAQREARMPGGAPGAVSGAPAAAAQPPGLDEAGIDALTAEHDEMIGRGDLAGAEQVRTRMLDAVGGDASKLPVSVALGDLDHTAFPNTTPEQFGAMIDQGDGLGQGTYARYQAAGQELERMRAALPPGADPNSPQGRAFEEKRQQYVQMRQRIQGRATQHYHNAVLRPMLERDMPEIAAGYQDLQARMARGEPVDPAQAAALRDRASTVVQTFGEHALRQAVTSGVRSADGTPIRTAAEFVQAAGKTRPVVGPDGKPVTRVVDGPNGPQRVPLTEPDGPLAQAVHANVENQLLAMIPGRQVIDAQGRPSTQQLVDPMVSHTIFERMDDQSRMLSYAGLGLGAIGALGAIFGFGGSWLPILGMLGAGFGLHKATGGDFTQLGQGSFWRGLAGGVTGNRQPQDAATLDAMARPHEALNNASPMGQVSLATLQQSPQFAGLVSGQLPAAQTLQTIAAVRPHEREQLRTLAAQNPNVGRMIDQVNQFEAQRGQQADQAAAAPAPGAPAAPGASPAAAPAAAPAAGGLRDYYATLGVRGGNEAELNRNLQTWFARASDQQVRQAVAGMPPAVRQEAQAGLAAKVQEAGGWGRVRTGAFWGDADAVQAQRLGRLLGIPEAAQ